MAKLPTFDSSVVFYNTYGLATGFLASGTQAQVSGLDFEGPTYVNGHMLVVPEKLCVRPRTLGRQVPKAYAILLITLSQNSSALLAAVSPPGKASIK